MMVGGCVLFVAIVVFYFAMKDNSKELEEGMMTFEEVAEKGSDGKAQFEKEEHELEKELMEKFE